MSFTGYTLTAVLLLMCSYVFVFILFVANMIRQEAALKYFKYSLAAFLIISFLLLIFTSMIVSIALG